jgi:2-heptyl-3-hydroxy-4(1H)-quinolone synthase
MKVLIQGAGIAGLSLAREMMRRSIDFTVVEQSEVLKPLGAGITLATNALKCLSATLDIDALRRCGQSLELMRVHDASGTLLSTMPTRLPADPYYGIAIHRHALHEALLEGLESQRILLGRSIESIVPSANDLQVTLSDSTTHHCDFLVGADGIRSAIRGFVTKESRLRFSGETCWRAVVPRRLDRPEQSMEVWGRGKRLGYIQIAPDLLYIYATLAVDAAGIDLAPNELLSTFSDLHGEASYMVRLLCSARLLIHDDLEELEPTFWAHGRVILIGDAAHAMTPNLGQGAAMAIEDAYCLARIWSSNSGTDSLAEFESARRSRVAFIQKESWKIGQVARWSSRPVVWLRNTLIRLLPKSSHDKLTQRIFGGVAHPEEK